MLDVLVSSGCWATIPCVIVPTLIATWVVCESESVWKIALRLLSCDAFQVVVIACKWVIFYSSITLLSRLESLQPIRAAKCAQAVPVMNCVIHALLLSVYDLKRRTTDAHVVDHMGACVCCVLINIGVYALTEISAPVVVHIQIENVRRVGSL